MIRLRNVNHDSFEAIEAKLLDIAYVLVCQTHLVINDLETKGITKHLGKFLIFEDWDGANSMSCYKGDERHHKFVANGEFKNALDSWPFGQPAERNSY